MENIQSLQNAFKRYIKIKKEGDDVPDGFWVEVAEYWNDTKGNDGLNRKSAQKRFVRRYRRYKNSNLYNEEEVLDEILNDLSKDDRTYKSTSDEDERYEDFSNKKELPQEKTNKKITYDKQEKTVSIEGIAEEDRIKSIEDLKREANIDENIYDIEKYIDNVWEVTSWKKGYPEVRQNFQVKAWLRNKFFDKVDPEWVQNYFDREVSNLPPFTVSPRKGLDSEEQVCVMADLHAGGFTENMKLVEDYNIESLQLKMERICAKLNARKKRTHLKILGDLIESFTGKNKKDVWKQIEAHGIKVMFVVADMLIKLIQNCPYIVSVSIISGNHDRISETNEEDPEGQVAYGVYEIIKRAIGENLSFISYDPLILSEKHGDVNYIMLHGHLPISKKNPNKLILDFGDPYAYNVILTAHKHEELVKEATAKYRVVQAPSLVPTGKFAERMGVHSTTGFLLFQENEYGSVNTESIVV